MAAKRYRAWAKNQMWTAKGPLATRSDFCRKIGDVGYWFNLWGNPWTISNHMTRAMAKFPGIPLGLHWYKWHKIPFDNSYPNYFPEESGMKETTAWLKSKGVVVMPYINGRLWDPALPSFSNAVSAASRKCDGSYWEERYGKRTLVPMCPMAPLWHKTMCDVCERLMSDIGVDSVYLDQICSGVPRACHNAAHGHKLGGGDMYVAGYRSMMSSIRKAAMRHGCAGLTTELAQEPFVDSFDAFLVWVGREPDDVPFLPAVYSGYAVYFGCPRHWKDSLDAYCALNGRDFLWGCQLGWSGNDLLKDERAGELEFTLRLCRMRLLHKDFFVYGELLGELPKPQGMPMVRARLNGGKKPVLNLPAVMGTVWSDFSGKRKCAFLVNVTGETQTYVGEIGGSQRAIAMEPRSVVAVEY